MIRIIKNSIGLLLFITFISSCNDGENCTLAENRLLRINFVRINAKGVEADTAFTQLIVSGGNFSDTFASKSTILIPLSQLADSSDCNFDFYVTKNTIDTTDSSSITVKSKIGSDNITFYYTRSLELVSTDCGFNTRFKLHNKFAGTRTVIDSIAFLNSTIDYEAEKNLKIYIKVSQ